MTITQAGGLLRVDAPEVVDYVDNMSDYTGIKLTATESCGTPFVQAYDNAFVTSQSGKFWVDMTLKALFVAPSMIALPAFRDCIMKFDVKFQHISGYTLISNCAFIDLTYSCKVAATLQNITTEGGDGISSMIHLLHYSLFNGSNCGCNCSEMCEVFIGLTKLLTGIDIEVLNDCGC